MSISPYIDIQPEIVQAFEQGKGVVALESTIISHGMPYPQNVETAKAVEQMVRSTGAIPATIAIINGRLKAGLTAHDLDLLGKAGHEVTKCSRRDLPFVVSQKKIGATTVAATMIIAKMAGIQVFATGGIGGVHRGANKSMDISADLQELARTDVAVISAGAKAILDLGLTLEYLETMGVPVIGYQTEDFPAFYVRTSGFKVDYRLDEPSDIANALRIKWSMGMNGGALIANPIPLAAEMDNLVIQEAIEQSIRESEEKGIQGKEITPFLLARIEEITLGASLRSNIELVLNNAQLAGRIATALASIKN